MSNDSNHEKRPLGLTLIAVGKAIKAVVLVGVAIAALKMVNGNPPDELLRWADLFRIDAGNRYFNSALAKVAGASTKQLEELGIGTFLYAIVFAIEGVGLWLQKRWAEYVTIGVTLSFIPLEVYELIRHTSGGKIVTLILNIAALVYLVVRVFTKRSAHPHSSALPAGGGTA